MEESKEQSAVIQETLVQCTEKLCTGISQDPLKVAQKLFECKFVSGAQVSSSRSPSTDSYHKASVLVEAIRSRIKTQSDFESLMRILDECTWLENEVKNLQEVYEKEAKRVATPTSDNNHVDGTKGE